MIHARDFIKATPEGLLDLEGSKKLLFQIASAGGSLDDYEVILDTRKARSRLSVSDLWHLAAELGNLRQAFARKTAVLCPLERFDNAQFFALCADIRGCQVRAFTSFESAMDWLSSDDA